MESLTYYLQQPLLNHLPLGSLFILQNESIFYHEMIDIPSDMKKTILHLLRVESTKDLKELTSILDGGGPSQLISVNLFGHDQLQLPESFGNLTY